MLGLAGAGRGADEIDHQPRERGFVWLEFPAGQVFRDPRVRTTDPCVPRPRLNVGAGLTKPPKKTAPQSSKPIKINFKHVARWAVCVFVSVCG